MSTLSKYLGRTADKPCAFARRIGVAPSTITRIMKGERGVSISLAKKIEAETNGAVSAAELLGLSPPHVQAAE